MASEGISVAAASLINLYLQPLLLGISCNLLNKLKIKKVSRTVVDRHSVDPKIFVSFTERNMSRGFCVRKDRTCTLLNTGFIADMEIFMEFGECISLQILLKFIKKLFHRTPMLDCLTCFIILSIE